MTPSLDLFYREIQLTQGKVTLVDCEDYIRLNQWKWHAQKLVRSSGKVTFYAARNEKLPNGKRKTIRMHWDVMNIAHDSTKLVDHISTDTLDNRKSNLRLATFAGNARNASLRLDSSSGLKGVSWHKGHCKFKSSIRVDGVLIHLGYFLTPEPAHDAYCEAALKYHGEFRRIK